MGSTVEHKYFIINLWDSKGNWATWLCKMFTATDQHALQSYIILDNSVDRSRRYVDTARNLVIPLLWNRSTGCQNCVIDTKKNVFTSSITCTWLKSELISYNYWNFCAYLIIFTGYIEENKSGCFLLKHTVYKCLCV